jgi:glycosyltransferase involved in cell wall biosynthesis
MIPNLVSIIIPSYNRFELLCNCIRSVLNNTYKNIEIIVVNDKSTDDRYYSGYLEKFPKTKIIHLQQNMREKLNHPCAQGATRQIGVENSTGEYVSFLDDDDFFSNDKIETQLNSMKQHSDCLFSTTNMYLIRHKSINTDFLDFENIGILHDKKLPEKFTKNIILKENYICNSTVIMHRKLIEKAGKILPEKFEDWMYWIRALDHIPYCLYINKPLSFYTIDNNKFYSDTLSLKKTFDEIKNHVEKSIKNAENLHSNLCNDILNLDGMSGYMTRHFYNNICSLPNCNYLEIGVWHGSSSVSALYKNKINECVFIDNWSLFQGNKDIFYENVEKFNSENSKINVIEGDCFSVDLKNLPEFDIYLYDGGHEYENQYKAIEYFLPKLKNNCIVLIDDWNWDEVKNGTLQAFTDLNVNIKYNYQIRTPQPHNEFGKTNWWNGIGIFIIERKK